LNSLENLDENEKGEDLRFGHIMGRTDLLCVKI